MNRTIFLIDGFNLYHSLIDARKDLKGASTKWLNIYSLCKSHLHLISKDATIEKIYYFSALAHHLSKNDPGKVARHSDYIKCLESTGVCISLGRFKGKDVKQAFSDPKGFGWCKVHLRRHEEKETDVAIATKLFEIMFTGACDTAVMVTGDTDLAPSARLVRSHFPLKKLIFAFPYLRKNTELLKISNTYFHIDKNTYTKHQFPDPFILSDGTHVSKPTIW